MGRVLTVVVRRIVKIEILNFGYFFGSFFFWGGAFNMVVNQEV